VSSHSFGTATRHPVFGQPWHPKRSGLSAVHPILCLQQILFLICCIQIWKSRDSQIAKQICSAARTSAPPHNRITDYLAYYLHISPLLSSKRSASGKEEFPFSTFFYLFRLFVLFLPLSQTEKGTAVEKGEKKMEKMKKRNRHYFPL
jgi:hypothetical protein